MNYRRNKRRTTLYISLLIVVFVAFVYFLGGSILRGTENASHALFIPIIEQGDKAGGVFTSLSSAFLFKQSLQEENTRLKEELTRLQLGIYTKKSILDENKELKELLGRDLPENTMLATILARPNRSLYDTIVVDIGEGDGVSEGDKVIAFGEIAIGTIARTHKESSVVELYSNAGRKTNVLIGEEQLSATAEGSGGFNFIVKLPKNIEVAEGDYIVLPDISVSFLGIVASVQKEPNDPFQTILFRNPINIHELKWVEVIISKALD